MSDKIQLLLIVFGLGITGFVGGLQVIVPQRLDVFEMDFLNLTCNATDYAEGTNLTFSWRKLTSMNFHPLAGPSLILTPVRIEDDGDYECQVNSSTDKATANVRISVQFSPRWTLLTMTKFAGELGERVILNCSVYASPLPIFYWINPQGMNMTTSSEFEITTTGAVSLLSIKAVQQSDYGNYTCVARNVAGVRRFILPFLMPGKPDSPLQCNATEVESTSASLQCIPGFSGGQSQLNYVVTKESPGSTKAEMTKSSIRSAKDGLVIISVEDLSPGLNFTLKIYAENKYGQSDDSYGVLVWTRMGGRPLPLAIIIGVSVGGGVFLILVLILLIICCIKCPGCRKNDPLSNRQGKSLPAKRKKARKQEGRLKQQSTNGQHSLTDHTDHPIAPQLFLNLNHNPGESVVGVENRAYVGDVNLERSRFGANERLAEDRGMMERNHMHLAGHGALRTMVEMSSFEKPRSSVKRCSIPVPPFQPDVPWEYQREKLFIRKKLGEGSYGEVWQAKAEGILGRPGQRMVAVKMLRDDYTPEEEQYLYKDLEVMKLLQPHPNTMLLLGCCSKTRPLYLIMELATNGSLLSLLRRQRHAFSPNNLDEDQPKATRQRHVNLMMQDLMKFALQISNGMDYISSNQLIHRDLAARNILIDEQMVCKISDFGALEDIVEKRQYESKTRRCLPLRWMAPESLTISEYSVRTDVWSFGILLWEIITLGSTPYPGLSGPQVLELIQKGSHMMKPTVCPDAMFGLMKACWRFYPTKRPLFSALKDRLSLLTEQSSRDCIYVDQMAENAFEILYNQPGEKC